MATQVSAAPVDVAGLRAIKTVDTMDTMEEATEILLGMKSTKSSAKLPAAADQVEHQIEFPFAPTTSVLMTPEDKTDATTTPFIDPAAATIEKKKPLLFVPIPSATCRVFKYSKRGRDEEEKLDGWNVNVRCHAGGIKPRTESYIAKDAMSALLGLRGDGGAPRTLSTPEMKLTFCMHVVPGGVALAKWPIPEHSKELKIMAELEVFCRDFSPNTKGIIHPALLFSSVDIPIQAFDDFVNKAFPRWTKKDRAFYNFSSSIGISKTPQVNESGKKVVVLTFSPIAFNKNLDRLCTAHGRKPKIRPQQCAEPCCKGKWDAVQWQSLLANY